MSEQWTATVRTVVRESGVADRVRVASWGAVLTHTLVTWWALAASWFYSDDFIFLDDATSSGLTLDFLFTPHDSQLMPVGVLVSWLVAQAGPFSWAAAAASTVLLSALAVWACARMLRTLFGERPLILVPLFFYALTPMAIEGWVWWAAALNTVPIHIAFFLAITGVVQWWRERRAIHLVHTLAAVALGALSGPRGLVMVVPLGLLVLLVLVPPTRWRAPVRVMRDLAPLVVPGALVAIGYLAIYRSTTPAPVTTDGSAPAGRITANLIIESWLPSVFGGPWSWFEDNPPMNQPTAPDAALVACGLVLAVVLAWCWRRNRRATTAAVVILVAQLSVTVVALVYGRGLQLGADAGLMTRYLTDTVPVTTLVIGLLLIPVPDRAPDLDAPDHRPSTLGRWPRAVTATVAVAFVASSLTSTATYMSSWHDAYPAKQWAQNAVAQLSDDPGEVADVIVPPRVQSPLSYPNNLPSRILAPLGRDVEAVTQGTNLRILDDQGNLRPAAVVARASAEPGPAPECGYRVGDDWTRVALEADGVIFWWISLGYLASADGQVEVQVAGREAFTMPVLKGLNTFVFSGEDSVSSLRLRALTPALTVCVDTVTLGDLVPVP